MRDRRPWKVLWVALILSGSALLTAWGIILAQQQVQLTVLYTSKPLPVTDPTSAIWDDIASVEVPLTAQAGVPPALPQPSISSMRVRAVHNGEWISFLVEWSDGTKDMRATKPTEFRDAVAIQFPVDASIPGVCMGMRGKPVNLWHWKADWQADIDEGFRDIVDAYPNFWMDYYPFAVGNPPYRVPTDFSSAEAKAYLVGWAAGNPLSDPVRVTPAEELIAMGFGSAEHKLVQGVLSRGVWTGGEWRVTFSRLMTVSEQDAVQFKPTEKAFVALAAWNGSNQEVGARKQMTTDMTLMIEAVTATVKPAPRAVFPWWGALLVGAALIAIASGIIYGYLRWTRGRGKPS